MVLVSKNEACWFALENDFGYIVYIHDDQDDKITVFDRTVEWAYINNLPKSKKKADKFFTDYCFDQLEDWPNQEDADCPLWISSD